ncbi:magnesium transporter, CorA family [Bacillus cereus G9241]|nr:Magnesium and cobalt transport protein CorA [Bacillus cereus]EAL14779.1 magnesium transporter, CorA family [Bacillus cereus G9241]CJB89263.1 Mg2+ and Co2+ ABC transporter [Streptococcus pneumoniae]QBZ25061.1 Magnesium and cobalt transport protein CorA [Bacillus cereus]QDD83242.1 Magnesium and cobalt transport protein CorA [Bacillus cereus]
MQKGCWINVLHPTEEEIQYLVQTLNVDLDFIKDPLDDEERSRIEKEDNNTLIIVDIPTVRHDEEGNSIYDTIPIGMIVMPDCFVTICLEENPIFERFINQRIKEFYTFKKTRFALQLLYTISTYYLRYLKQINRKTIDLEHQLNQSMKNKEIFTLLGLEKSLVYFTTSLKANKIVIQKLMRNSTFLKMYEDDQDLLEDVLIENKQAIEMAEIYSHILSGMMNTFSSVISNNLNSVMKLLTSITIILSLPTMVSSFFGMNVKVPFEGEAHGFVIVLIICVTLSFTLAFVFWKKRYF